MKAIVIKTFSRTEDDSDEIDNIILVEDSVPTLDVLEHQFKIYLDTIGAKVETDLLQRGVKVRTNLPKNIYTAAYIKAYKKYIKDNHIYIDTWIIENYGGTHLNFEETYIH